MAFEFSSKLKVNLVLPDENLDVLTRRVVLSTWSDKKIKEII